MKSNGLIFGVMASAWSPAFMFAKPIEWVLRVGVLLATARRVTGAISVPHRDLLKYLLVGVE